MNKIATLSSSEFFQMSDELKQFVANMECDWEEFCTSTQARWKENSDELLLQLQAWRNEKQAQWHRLLIHTAESLKKLPNEIKQRAIIKNIREQICQLEIETQKTESSLAITAVELSEIYQLRTRDDITRPELDTGKNNQIVGPKEPSFFSYKNKRALFDTSCQNIRLQAELLYKSLQTLETHPLMIKLRAGKKILSSRGNLQWNRKFYHAFSGLSGLWLYAYSGLSTSIVTGILAAYFAVAFVAEIARRKSPTFNVFVCRVMGKIMRECEKDKISSATWFLFSVLCILLVFPQEVNILPILFVSVGDPLAGIVGSLWGKTKLAPHVSLQGCLAFFIFSFMASLYFAGFGLLGFTLVGKELLFFSALAALAGTLSESLFKKFDDNLTIPLMSAPAIWLLIKLFTP